MTPPARMATRKSVELAKLAAFWDDAADDRLVWLFPPDNDPDAFQGTAGDLSAIRDSMKKYEETAAGIGEDNAFYNARFELQHVEAPRLSVLRDIDDVEDYEDDGKRVELLVRRPPTMGAEDIAEEAEELLGAARDVRVQRVV